MTKIIVEVDLPKESEQTAELSLLLSRIANQIEEGYTSGHEANYSWDILKE